MVQVVNSLHTWSAVSAEGSGRALGAACVTADANEKQDRLRYSNDRSGIETSTMLSPETLVVGLSLQQESAELLSWSFNTAAHAGDHFVVLHIIEHASIAGKGTPESTGRKCTH